MSLSTHGTQFTIKISATIVALVTACCAPTAAQNDPELVPRRGRGVSPPHARGNGPWATRVMLATSTNGLDFTRLHFVLSDQAGVPNVVVDHDQHARVYYVDFGNGNVLACAIQERSASLTNWAYRRVQISGINETRRSDPVDPTVVALPDKRYRLYYMQAAPTPSVYSAISSNGIDFANEDGVRFTAAPAGVFDPLVLKFEREWLLWAGPDGKFSARSDDGRKFSPSGEFRVEGVRFMPWSAVTLPKRAGYRLYGNFVGPGEWSGGISSVFSKDGKRWKRERGIRLSLDSSRYALESAVAPDNGCAILPDGTWLMAYVATIPLPRGD